MTKRRHKDHARKENNPKAAEEDRSANQEVNEMDDQLLKAVVRQRWWHLLPWLLVLAIGILLLFQVRGNGSALAGLNRDLVAMERDFTEQLIVAQSGETVIADRQVTKVSDGVTAALKKVNLERTFQGFKRTIADTLDGPVEKISDATSELVRQKSAALRSVEELGRTVGECQQQLTTLRQKHEKLKENVREHSAELTKAKEELSSTNRNLEEARTKIEDTKKQMRELQMENKSLIAGINQLRAQRASLDRDIVVLYLTDPHQKRLEVINFGAKERQKGLFRLAAENSHLRVMVCSGQAADPWVFLEGSELTGGMMGIPRFDTRPSMRLPEPAELFADSRNKDTILIVVADIDWVRPEDIGSLNLLRKQPGSSGDSTTSETETNPFSYTSYVYVIGKQGVDEGQVEKGLNVWKAMGASRDETYMQTYLKYAQLTRGNPSQLIEDINLVLAPYLTSNLRN